jgi:hypothetical protein
MPRRLPSLSVRIVRRSHKGFSVPIYNNGPESQTRIGNPVALPIRSRNFRPYAGVFSPALTAFPPSSRGYCPTVASLPAPPPTIGGVNRLDRRYRYRTSPSLRPRVHSPLPRPYRQLQGAGRIILKVMYARRQLEPIELIEYIVERRY